MDDSEQMLVIVGKVIRLVSKYDPEPKPEAPPIINRADFLVLFPFSGTL